MSRYHHLLACLTAIALSNLTQPGFTTPAAPAELSPTLTPGAFPLDPQNRTFVPDRLRRNDNPFPYRAVIGKDDRVPMMSREFPWAAIGRVEGTSADGEPYNCTGTLVAETIVLTNAHCVIHPESGKVSRRMSFKPNLIDGELQSPEDVAHVQTYYAGTNFRDGNDASDWALLKLDRPLGKKYGYLGWKNLPYTQLTNRPRQVKLVGYSADFPKTPRSIPGIVLKAGPGMTAGVHRGCSILKKQADLLLHDCDTTGGASGGPIISKFDNDYYIVAIHAGWRRINGQVLNYAVEIARIEEWIQANSGQ